VNCIKTSIANFDEIQNAYHSDNRGSFLKTFNSNEFALNGLSNQWAEVFFTRSRKNVIRGLHFQIPPLDHTKLVTCVEGKIIDVVVDMRKESITFGKHEMIELSAERGNSAHIGIGLAHGFYVVSEIAIVAYCVSSIHSPPHDSGIRWDSAKIKWPIQNPVISERDAKLPSFASFVSPF